MKMENSGHAFYNCISLNKEIYIKQSTGRIYKATVITAE